MFHAQNGMYVEILRSIIDYGVPVLVRQSISLTHIELVLCTDIHKLVHASFKN